eukprot:TRINITY_DN6905_c0_g2_i1.p1 TRINITY_DN6905_c0_g2~~TRINITY_DN6905_c0_g2_i1.p1  ORF type:complete len:137 (-),score=1.91 TRINITY_DN6905_c0_g2_i1:252-662(-)
MVNKALSEKVLYNPTIWKNQFNAHFKGMAFPPKALAQRHRLDSDGSPDWKDDFRLLKKHLEVNNVCVPTSFHVGGKSYLTIANSAESLLLRRGRDSVIVWHSKRCLIVAWVPSPGLPHCAMVSVGAIADYLSTYDF